MAAVEPLTDRWYRRWEQTRAWLALGPVFIPVGERLFERYCEPWRHYHDARHILACLESLDTYPGKVGNLSALELAIWFHDAVYEPQASDNEAASARLFRREFQDFASGIEKVENLILATRHSAGRASAAPAARNPDADLISDIDLAILGAPRQRYQMYAEDIRREYSHVDEPSYRQGRCEILKSFLKRKTIFQTRHFRRLFESVARENLVDELDRLS